jgi:hypothetical protein
MKILLALWFVAIAGPPDAIREWMRFEISVRDQTIRKEDARKQFPILFQSLKEAGRKFPFRPASPWVFPVQGYGPADMGTGGFRPDIRYGSSPVKGYDFYDGNRHGGHPAYDIFIRDRNQDSLDDRNQQPVPVLAPVDLLILSTESRWEPGSEIRGGRYIWGLDPIHDRIFYFAHLNEIRTAPGTYCKAGTAIGTLGRTGKNAAAHRSPTHLHLMVLAVEGDTLKPLDYRMQFRRR